MYQRVGGEKFFEELTTRFYASVAADPLLARLYPSDPEAFEMARCNLRDFLVQFFGGPPIYNQRRGSPRLRLRHLPFAIGTAERDAWVLHMSAAVREAHLRPLDQAQMLTYFESAATHLVNHGEAAGEGEAQATRQAQATQTKV